MIAELVTAVCLCLLPPAGPFEPADRLDPPPPPPPVEVWPTGIYGLPFAPFGLEPCDQMMYYAAQFGLPETFRRIGWRESNCRNEDGVRTSCCHGYWQLHRMHFDAQTLRLGLVCGAWTVDDVNSDHPLDKQRQACSAKQLYDAAGLSPWSATR